MANIDGEKVPLVLPANSSAVESIGQPKDEAQLRADAAQIEGQEGQTVAEAAKKGEKKAGAPTQRLLKQIGAANPQKQRKEFRDPQAAPTPTKRSRSVHSDSGARPGAGDK